ncbi:MAG TPA: succinate dehydrogenase/fumarate reductase iron-sulfur subunit [Leptospiraceae bacterium]|nr:succinate dehydrogenase/fumarate reductase iron-sulfur subunit [Leptospiraceae bacterium]HMY65366.1 succinate dehydrogenase/fumarate reductase iron-sulfur subunit [Leptospiraceae bacterium]HMZ57252.1 succinate dehydrogenase/fumarate reductase iron-sulfur subunit [Leptospiraceae bacterium]HNF12953.1 succinate dehydrogenase/fumarate reductase iron-sulfur subunit [Leptospiraceae bacterium]HNF23046.1 succinate dehydrogenase/fumarate reductase iron-sulfur subunit [Leptospiraceae bacterium]
MNLKLKVWRQKNASDKGKFVDYIEEGKGISTHASFLEMLDIVNERLESKGEEPIAFDHDCREGICGTCSLFINGFAHGFRKGTTACQLHMHNFKDGDELVIEPWRAKAFPVLRDLIVDRSAFDRIMQAGGFISINTGGAPDANALPIPKTAADLAMDAAACIGCGACVASCKNASAMLFVSAKVSQLALLPQGQVERKERVRKMLAAMDKEGFGNCTNQYECEAACPKEISVSNIARLNREYLGAVNAEV